LRQSDLPFPLCVAKIADMFRIVWPLSVAIWAACVPAASADACLQEIRALHETTFNPFARPPHRHGNTVHDADGAVSAVYSNLVETPLRTISGMPDGRQTMIVDHSMWERASPDAVWLEGPATLPTWREETLRRQTAEMARNLRDVTCHGPVVRGDETLIHYTFTTRTDPIHTGAYFGATNDAYVAPDTGLLRVLILDDFINPWANAPRRGRNVMTFDYDPALRVAPPQ